MYNCDHETLSALDADEKAELEKEHARAKEELVGLFAPLSICLFPLSLYLSHSLSLASFLSLLSRFIPLSSSLNLILPFPFSLSFHLIRIFTKNYFYLFFSISLSFFQIDISRVRHLLCRTASVIVRNSPETMQALLLNLYEHLGHCREEYEEQEKKVGYLTQKGTVIVLTVLLNSPQRRKYFNC